MEDGYMKEQYYEICDVLTKSKKYADIRSKTNNTKQENILIWEVEKNIRSLLEDISSNKDDEHKAFLRASCSAAIKKVKKLMLELEI